MNEWLAVALAGGLGGGFSSFLPAGTDVTWPPFLERRFSGHDSWEFFAHLARNTIMGGLASFIVWALASPDAVFGGRDVTVGIVASAIIVGGGGVTLVNKLFQQSAKLEYREQGVEMAEALMRAEAESEDA